MTQSIQEEYGSSNQLQTKISFVCSVSSFRKGKSQAHLPWFTAPQGFNVCVVGEGNKAKNNSFFIVFKISSFSSCSSHCYYPNQLTRVLCLWNYPNFKQGESPWHKIFSQTKQEETEETHKEELHSAYFISQSHPGLWSPSIVLARLLPTDQTLISGRSCWASIMQAEFSPILLWEHPMPLTFPTNPRTAESGSPVAKLTVLAFSPTIAINGNACTEWIWTSIS